MTAGAVGALTGIRGAAVAVALLVGLLFVAGSAYMAFRKPKRPGTPDIPSAMRPGPVDEELEESQAWKMRAWSTLVVLFVALWIPIVWLIEPRSNAQDQIRLNESYVQQGSMLVQLSSPDNPAGFGCVRCHGEDLNGGFNVYNGQRVVVPSLRTVCSGPNGNPPHSQIKSLQDIVNTIAQGRTGTDMPSWSVKYTGPLDDDQIQAIVDYILSIQEPVPGGVKNNVCINPIKS